MVGCRLLLACVLAFAAAGKDSHAAMQHRSSEQHGATNRRLQQAAAAGTGIINRGVMSPTVWPVPAGYT